MKTETKDIVDGTLVLIEFLKEAFKLSLSRLELRPNIVEAPTGYETTLSVLWEASGTRENISRKTHWYSRGWNAKYGVLSGKNGNAILQNLVSRILEPNTDLVLKALPLIGPWNPPCTLEAWNVDSSERNAIKPWHEFTDMDILNSQVFNFTNRMLLKADITKSLT